MIDKNELKNALVDIISMEPESWEVVERILTQRLGESVRHYSLAWFLNELTVQDLIDVIHAVAEK